MHLFWLQGLQDSHPHLDPTEADHALRVLRLKPGDVVWATAGGGIAWQVRLGQPQKHALPVELLQEYMAWHEHPYEIHLLLSPLHSRERQEWLLEKAVELGVTHLWPCTFQRTEGKSWPLDRLQRVMQAAVKQCLRSRLPSMAPLQSLEHQLALLPAGPSFVLKAGTETALLQALQLLPPVRLLLAIGPEGDFSPREMDLLTGRNFVPAHLGHTRLRAETAAIHALGLAKAAWGW